MNVQHPLCIFCSQRDFPPSKEDVLADWIRREFLSGVWAIERKAFHPPFGPQDVTTTQQFNRRRRLIVSRKVCKNCNNTWMSKLEGRAQSVMTPLIHGRPSTLSKEQQLVVAQWLTKTVMAFEFTGVKGSPIFFSSIERQVFMRSLAIPAGTLMFLGSYVGSHQMFARETRPAFQDADADLSSRDEMRGYSVTFAIKHLALQIITFRRPENPSSGVDTIQIRGDWSSAEVQIWPLVDDTVRWPPPEHFDDEGFDLFVNRWRPSE